MTNTTLPQSAVDEDHRLEVGTESASERLFRHRWHWTLDESNSERVTIAAYARSVGRSKSTINQQVNAYANWEANGRGRSLNEEANRANVGIENEVTIEAIAKARGLSFDTVRKTRGQEVRAVRHQARDSAEIKGTEVTDEIPRVAKFYVDAEESDRKAEVERKEAHSLRYHEVSKHLLSSLFAARRALHATTDVPFDDEERELLADDVRQVREVLQLVDHRLAGVTSIDWDEELKKILKGATA